MAKTKIDPTLLGFDFDGVIADTAEVFLRLACEDYGLCDLTCADIVNFEIEQCLDLERTQADALFHKILVDSVGTGLQPMEDAIQVLGELAERNPVSVITARSLADPVHDWFADFFPASTCKAIKVIAMGAHDGKPEHIHGQGLRFFIDDRAETCVQLNKAGIQPFVFHQPWNHNRHQLPSVSSWQDIRELVS
uniref:5' nucleotidase, NT5C type n=1 Tax=Candidatus Electrothrix sp. TaxID=2170559 RepID=UPI004056A991